MSEELDVMRCFLWNW